MRKTYDNVEICFSLKLFALSLYIMLFIVFSQEQEDSIISMLNFCFNFKKVKVHTGQRPTRLVLIPVSLA